MYSWYFIGNIYFSYQLKKSIKFGLLLNKCFHLCSHEKIYIKLLAFYHKSIDEKRDATNDIQYTWELASSLLFWSTN